MNEWMQPLMHCLKAVRYSSSLLCSSARAEHLLFLFKESPCKTYRVQVNDNVASVLDNVPHHTTYVYNQIIYWILNWWCYKYCRWNRSISECWDVVHTLSQWRDVWVICGHVYDVVHTEPVNGRVGEMLQYKCTLVVLTFLKYVILLGVKKKEYKVLYPCSDCWCLSLIYVGYVDACHWFMWVIIKCRYTLFLFMVAMN
jgi:hypothetical protein